MAAVANYSQQAQEEAEEEEEEAGATAAGAPPRRRHSPSTSTCSATPTPATASFARRSSTGTPRRANAPPRPLPTPQSPPAPAAPQPFGVYTGPVRPRAGEAAARPRRLRPAPGRGAELRRARHAERRPLPDAAERPAQLNGPEPVDDDGDPIAPGGQLRPRPPLVARPHGPQHPPAGRAHGAGLPRLVRDLERGVDQPAADDRPVEPVPRRLLRLVPRPDASTSPRTRRCCSG